MRDAAPGIDATPGFKLVSGVTVFTVWLPKWEKLTRKLFYTSHANEIEKLQIMFRRGGIVSVPSFDFVSIGIKLTREISSPFEEIEKRRRDFSFF